MKSAVYNNLESIVIKNGKKIIKSSILLQCFNRQCDRPTIPKFQGIENFKILFTQKIYQKKKNISVILSASSMQVTELAKIAKKLITQNLSWR